MRGTMADIPDFAEKIDSLVGRVNGPRTQRELAARLEMQPSQLTETKTGRTGGQQQGRISVERLEILADVMVEVAKAQLSKTEALQLLKGDDLRAFNRALDPEPNLLDTVQASKRTLEVDASVRDCDALHAVGGLRAIPDDVITMRDVDCLWFTVNARVGKRLTVLCLGFGGVWEVIVPSNYHTGVVEETPTYVPKTNQKGVHFVPPYNLHRFIFIEHDASFELLPSDWAKDDHLRAEYATGMALNLGAPSNASKWRWAEKQVHVNTPHGGAATPANGRSRRKGPATT